MQELKNISEAACSYISKIDATKWLSSEWIINNNLPPRHGICTSNMSKSMNNMLQGARDVCWLECINIIITKISKRICSLREKYNNSFGVVDEVQVTMQTQWDHCSGFIVDQIEFDGDEFLITRSTTLLSQVATTHTINVHLKTCTCGLWQEYGYPCIDATAYMKLHEQRTLEYVLLHSVSPYYHVSNMVQLLTTNIRPVSIDKLKSDKETKPPEISLKRTAGRPRKIRVRKRNKVKPKIVIVCSKCKKPGHNARTCEARKREPETPLDNE
jgi:SWIM zinc finger